jgi:hypothetical protein
LVSRDPGDITARYTNELVRLNDLDRSAVVGKANSQARLLVKQSHDALGRNLLSPGTIKLF